MNDNTQKIIDIKKTYFEAKWTTFEGVMVKQIEGSPLVAAPVTGKKGSRRFDVIDTRGDREFLCQLLKKEVDYWLLCVHRGSLIDEILEEEDRETVKRQEEEERQQEQERENLQPSLF